MPGGESTILEADSHRVGFLMQLQGGAPAIRIWPAASVPANTGLLLTTTTGYMEISWDRHGDLAQERWRISNPGLATVVSVIEIITDRDSDFLQAADAEDP